MTAKARHSALLDADHRLFVLWNRRWANPLFDVLWYLGGHLAVVPLIGLLTAVYLLTDLGWARVRHGAVLLATLMVIWVLKRSIGRRRPGDVLDVRRPFGGGLPVADQSFPSGDTAQAAAISVLLMRDGGFGAWVLLYPVVVGLGRVYLGLHFPLDVAAGGLIGTSVALVTTTLWPA